MPVLRSDTQYWHSSALNNVFFTFNFWIFDFTIARFCYRFAGNVICYIVNKINILYRLYSVAISTHCTHGKDLSMWQQCILPWHCLWGWNHELSINREESQAVAKWWHPSPLKLGDSSYRADPHAIPQFIFNPAPTQLRSSILIRKEPVAVVSMT